MRLLSALILAFSTLTSTAYAAGSATAAPHHQQGSIMSTVIMLGAFFLIFYFLLIRPQSKRAKAQRALLNNVQVGDEVMTAAGIMGKIKTMDQNIVTLEIASDVVIQIQKSSISSTLPQGTFKTSH